ncbi:nucleoside deaminase [Chloroflexota bacterium]
MNFPRSRLSELMNHEQHMPFIKEAIQLAAAARQHGNHPFGALLVYQGQVVSRAENTVLTQRDITGHAELNLVRQGYSTLAADFLRQCVLYTSTEPCPMCSGAIYWAGIRTVVFGLSAARLNQHVGGKNTLNLPCVEVFERGASTEFMVIGPVLEDEALQPHIGFWR